MAGRFRSGPRDAYLEQMANPDPDAVYRELAAPVLGYLRGQGLDDPFDLLGEVFVQVARDLPRFEGDDAARRRWVFTIAHNRVQDEVRRRARRPRVVDREVPDQAAPPAEEPMHPALIDALAQLTPEQREVVLLRFVADLPLEQVAAITHRRVGAVKTMQRRAVAKLQQLVSYEHL